ncbi:MAG: hypothetical protein H8E67_02685 [Proteobacteria bacterium]|jgi:hypothetical protein|nr:hypothetical protein [Pseudomonadota bacterium]MBT5795441.1 hypothetical protein [Deltaproteobacteria bacterium]
MTNTILALHANLFQDANTVESALEEMTDNPEVKHKSLTPATMSEKDWDQILVDILSVEKIITL